MINFKRCTEVSDSKIYEAFNKGYADYIIKIRLTEEQFIKRFLGIECERKHSFVALDDEKPIGLILGDIQNYNNLKTMRCCGLAVIPEYRGTEVAHKLFDLHKSEAEISNCDQLFLEVIDKNIRAIKFYEKKGYKKVYDLNYYISSDLNSWKKNSSQFEIKEIEFDILKEKREELSDLHINWQNEFFIIEKLDNIKSYGVYDNNELIAALNIQGNGFINFIWVNKRYRNRGIATSLLQKAVKEMNLKNILTWSTNNMMYQGFLEKRDFNIKISQYEMTRVL
ncbi:MAG: GNAT family N-acetyltransferase [Firmicutes bacterium]|nr:GNAT family N-acetyltransferase [Bacillota bacterium]